MKMHAALYKQLLKVSMAGAVVGAWAPGQAWAVANLKPDWVRGAIQTQEPNCSFISDQKHRGRDNPLDDVIMDDHAAMELRQQFQDMSRDYELKRDYGLVDGQREQQRGDEVRGFGRQIFGEVRRHQTRKQTENLKKAAEREPSLHALVTPAAVVGAGAAVYTGTPVKLQLSDETQFRAATNVPKQKSELSLNSPAVNTSLALDMSKPEAKAPNAPPDQDPTHKQEKARLSFSRGLPIWELSSGVSYGMTTSTMNASLSKQLTEHLTAVVGSSRALQAQRSDSEESLKFFYGLSF